MNEPKNSNQTTGPQSSHLDNPFGFELFMGTDGYHYALTKGNNSNTIAFRVNSRLFRLHIVTTLASQNKSIKPRELDELVDHYKGLAETSGRHVDVFGRVALCEDGIEIDSGNPDNTRYKVSKSGVEVIKDGSKSIFTRTTFTKELPSPIFEGKGNFFRIKKYLNVSDPNKMFLMAWISFVLAHPKVSTSKYPLLVLFGSQGYGKSFLTNLLLQLIDPSNHGLRVLPNTIKDLAIMANSSHVVAFDNIRDFPNALSDGFCMASSGGYYTGRQLYTNDDTSSTRLHSAIVLNGIHQFITQPDLAQRCLQINLLPIDKASRRSESDLLEQLKLDLPYIFGGLLEYIAAVFAALPKAEVVHAERMIDFSKWLAAMELVDHVPVGTYQALYSSVVEEGQLEVVQGSLLGDAVYAFGMKQQIRPWTGTPAQLLAALNSSANTDIMRSPDWPKNPISLSKKMAGIKAPLDALGVIVNFTRGKERTYTVSLKDGVSDAY